jgi:predicted Rossmann fold nucleotide-binding protein DprA/Smf involved in DNA uptake
MVLDKRLFILPQYLRSMSLFSQLGIASPKGLWFGITGTWQRTTPLLEHDVRAVVRAIYAAQGGIATGAALGVDFCATDEALRCDPAARRLRVYVPATLQQYTAHYRQRAEEGVITEEQAEELVRQLTHILSVNPAAIIENRDATAVNRESYFQRNSAVVAASDAVIAFQVDNSEGTADTIQKAIVAGKPVKVFSYSA